MHPAYSVIIFTTVSGAGFGLLIWLAFSLLFLEVIPLQPLPGLVAFGLAFVLISIGLASSTLHLGRPERAWRAFSQWRTSWLSREGIVAVASYPVAGLFGLLWMLKPTSPWIGVLALLTTLLALLTLYCTGMIYASLPTVRAWYQPLVCPVYTVLALVTGGALALLLGVLLAGEVPLLAVGVELLLVGTGLVLKSAYWNAIDTAPRNYTAGAATGLGGMGKVRSLDPPHSRPNYVMREMGYEVGRRHAEKLRRFVLIGLFAVPAACLLMALLIGGSWALAPLVLAVVSAAAGVTVERWLFFAEAEHAAVLFYGKEAA